MESDQKFMAWNRDSMTEISADKVGFRVNTDVGYLINILTHQKHIAIAIVL